MWIYYILKILQIWFIYLSPFNIKLLFCFFFEDYYVPYSSQMALTRKLWSYIYNILFNSFCYISSSFHTVISLYYFRLLPSIYSCVLLSISPVIVFLFPSFKILSSFVPFCNFVLVFYFPSFHFQPEVHAIIIHRVLTAVLICNPYDMDMFLLIEGQ